MNNEVKFDGSADEVELAFYLNQVDRYLEGLYQDMSNGFHARARGEINNELALVFFHSKERYDNIKMLLQYLVYFVKAISVNALTNKDFSKPYDQFRNLISYHVNLLLEFDVKIAIMREYMQVLPLREHNLENMEKRILQQHGKLCELLDSAPTPTPDNFLKLFDALRQFSRFWFDLKNHQYQRIRRSDFYIYKLSNLLIEKKLIGQATFAFV